MFRKNSSHLQTIFFDINLQLPEAKRKKMEESEENVFYKLIFCNIREKDFEILYSENNAKPQCECLKNVWNIEENLLEEIWNGKVMQLYRKKFLNSCFDWCENKCISGIMPQNMLKSTRLGFNGE